MSEQSARKVPEQESDFEPEISVTQVSGPISLTEIRGWMRDIFFAAVTAILIVIFVVQPVKVEGTSMEPKLSDQERIFVNKFVYHFSGIDRVFS